PLPACMVSVELDGQHPVPDEEVVLDQRIFKKSFLRFFEDPLKPLLTNQLLDRLLCGFLPVQVKCRFHGVFSLRVLLCVSYRQRPDIASHIAAIMYTKIIAVNSVSYSRLETLKHQKSLLSEADRKSTRLNSSHVSISYAVFCLKKKK